MKSIFYGFGSALGLVLSFGAFAQALESSPLSQFAGTYLLTNQSWTCQKKDLKLGAYTYFTLNVGSSQDRHPGSILLDTCKYKEDCEGRMYWMRYYFTEVSGGTNHALATIKKMDTPFKDNDYTFSFTRLKRGDVRVTITATGFYGIIDSCTTTVSPHRQ